MNHIHQKTFLRLVLFVFALLPGIVYAAPLVSVSASPNNIQMGAQFNGGILKVTGSVPADSDVILRFTGAPEDLHLRKKGKVFGILWMNTGTILLKNVPKICLVDSSRSFNELGAAGATLQLESLNNTIEVEKSAQLGEVDVIHELLQLKKNDGLYTEATGGVILGPNTGTSRNFSAGITIPSAVAPGHYTVTAVAVQNGTVVGRQTTDVEANLIGFPAWLSRLAFKNGLLYGVLATIIAVISGLAIGLVFQSKGAH